ncbi:MAG: AMP-binding protein [Streptosporangiales bacterium]|nr:AMP-binding protein [Streptosporangiales bacterium]
MDLAALTVRSLLEEAVDSGPTAPYLIWAPDGREVSYPDFNERVDRAACMWRELGVAKGDRVAFMVDNSPEFLYAWLGLAKIGGILVAVNTGFRGEEIGYLLGDSTPCAALVDANHLTTFLSADAAARASIRQLLTVGEVPGYDHLAAAMAAADPVAPAVDLSGYDPMSLIYTSGTTGYPKGVIQTHKNFVLTGQAYPHWMRMQQGQRIYACLPLFHINSQSYSTMGAMANRGTIVLAPRFSASTFWSHVRQYRVNAFNLIGAMAVILSKKAPTADDLDNDAHVAYCVPALVPEMRDDIERKFQMAVVSGFGMSETTFGLLEPFDGVRKEGSMGVPRHHPDPSVPRTEACVVDDKGSEVGPGVVGELLLRNAAMMAGYWRDEERTAATLVDGWLHTGDSAWCDEDDTFYFVDRKKDIVRRRGENVSSLEVERIIEQHPAVLEAAVVGVPSEFTDEELLAYVVPRPGAHVTAGEVFAWCAGRLAGFKVPRFVELVADELPKTSTAKVQKSELRKLDAAALGVRIDRELEARQP